MAYKPKNDFPIWLASNASMDTYPANKPYEFRNKLIQALDFTDDNWTMALSEITYPNNYHLHLPEKFSFTIKFDLTAKGGVKESREYTYELKDNNIKSFDSIPNLIFNLNSQIAQSILPIFETKQYVYYVPKIDNQFLYGRRPPTIQNNFRKRSSSQNGQILENNSPYSVSIPQTVNQGQVVESNEEIDSEINEAQNENENLGDQNPEIKIVQPEIIESNSNVQASQDSADSLQVSTSNTQRSVSAEPIPKRRKPMFKQVGTSNQMDFYTEVILQSNQICNFIFNGNLNRLSIQTVLQDGILLKLNNNVTKTFFEYIGFGNLIYQDPSQTTRIVHRFQANNDPYRIAQHPSLFIYCDKAEYSMVGDTQAPLLLTIPSKIPTNNEIILEKPWRLTRVPIKKGYINEIEIALKDDHGNPINFKEGIVFLTIEFQRVKKD